MYLVWHYMCLVEFVYGIKISYNNAQRHEVGRLYQALMLLGLALSSEHLRVFGLHGAIYVHCVPKKVPFYF